MIIIAVGILLGIICSLPVGQIGVLSINRTLKYGFAAGFTIGVTSALLDSISCLGIMYGVSAFSQISSAKFVLYGINIVLLIYLGVTNILKKETNTKQQKEMLLKLGLTKQQIKDLKYEEARVKKIIELQEKTNNK